MVDGYDNGDAGAYTVAVSIVATPTCGDGFVDGAEFCDDGNVINDATCNSACTAACGDGVCTPGETSCTFAGDCVDDVNTCSGCDCTFVVGAPCQCDDNCNQFGDCCANDTATCGADQSTFGFSSPALALAIPDNGYNGTLGSMACKALPTVAEGTVTSVNSVTVAMTHTWIGDLTIKVVSPTGTVVTLVSRPGTGELADDGQGSSPENANLLAANPITFLPSALANAENMGNLNALTTLNVCAPVASGGDGVCNFIPSAGAAMPNGGLSLFAGQVPTGTWQVCVGDSSGQDTGTITSATINLTVGG